MTKGKKRKIIICIVIVILMLAGVMGCLFWGGGISYAAELVDGTLNAEHLYSKYALENYQLDFYVSTKGGWLPWNWGDSIGKGVMYGVYYITNALWSINTSLSSAVGSAVAEAYNLDFVGSVADSLGGNLQTIAGVSSSGFSSDGLYVKFLPWPVLLTGIYAGYHGMVKHESSKAISGILNLVLVYVISAAFIAFAPDYVKSINEFSTEISTSMLDIGAKILAPESSDEDSDSVDIIRDSLFSIQTYKPWLLLQFGTTDVDIIGQERIDAILAVSPESGESREDATIKEVEDYANANMSITRVPARLGNVLLLLVINIVISIFVFLLSGIMLLSQFLFILFLLFLPVSFLVAMMPGQAGKWKQAVIKVFNTMMMRAGISFLITVAFCLSNMVYGLTENSPFLLIGLLQILVFAGVFIEFRELLGMISLQENNAENLGRRMFRRPYMHGRQFMRRHIRNLKRDIRRTATAGTAGYVTGKVSAAGNEKTGQSAGRIPENRKTFERNKPGIGERTGKAFGHAAGAVTDLPSRAVDKVKRPIEKLSDLPTNAKYAVYSVGAGFKEERAQSEEQRKERQERRQNTREYKQQRMSDTLNKDVPKEKGGSALENTRKFGAEYKRPVTVRKGQEAAEKSKEKNDLGALPKNAVVNGHGTVSQEKRITGQQDRKRREYRAPVHVAANTPSVSEQNGKQRQQMNREAVLRKEVPVRTVSGREKAKSDKNNGMGELPKGAVLNGRQRPEKRKG